MKRTYFKGCEWCNATGYTRLHYNTFNESRGSTTALTNVCPVCKGKGTILVTEED